MATRPAPRDYSNAVLQWLKFPGIHDWDDFQFPLSDTLQWTSEQDNSAGLAEWLRRGSGIYWISGKPGSGKSVLMAHTYGQLRLQKERQGTNDHLVPSFWFCRRGSPLQRSLAGLCRAFLHHALERQPDMCRVAFPGWRSGLGMKDPVLEYLLPAIKNLIKDQSNLTKYSFLVDGLDQCEEEDIGELVKLLLDMSKCPNIKLLLSSRRQMPFQAAFRSCPTMRLETFTRPDIEAFIHAELWSDPFRRPELEIQEKRSITDYILEHSEGSFAWTKLAINSIVLGLESHESFDVLQARLRAFPRGWKQLQETMLEHERSSSDEIVHEKHSTNGQYPTKPSADVKRKGLFPDTIDDIGMDESVYSTSLGHNRRDTGDVTTYTRSEPTHESTLPTSVDDKLSVCDGEENHFSVYSFDYQPSLTPSQKDQLCKQFAGYLTSGLNIQNSEQCNTLLRAAQRVNDLLRMFTLLRSSQAGKEGDLKATGFVRASRPYVSQSTVISAFFGGTNMFQPYPRLYQKSPHEALARRARRTQSHPGSITPERPAERPGQSRQLELRI